MSFKQKHSKHTSHQAVRKIAHISFYHEKYKLYPKLSLIIFVTTWFVKHYRVPCSGAEWGLVVFLCLSCLALLRAMSSFVIFFNYDFTMKKFQISTRVECQMDLISWFPQHTTWKFSICPCFVYVYFTF